MFSSKQAHRFVAVLIAAFLVVTGLQGSASAATARSLSTSASPVAAAKGASVVFSGKLTRSPKGATVLVQRKKGKKWVKAATTHTTSSTGTYRVRLKRPTTYGSYDYRAYAPASKKLRATASRSVEVLALNSAYLSLTAQPSTITAGGSTALSGAAYPFKKGTLVTLQRRSGSTWVSLSGKAKLSASGTFSKIVSATKTTKYRAALPRSGSNAPAYSASRTVSVKPKISTTTLPTGNRFSAYKKTLTTLGHVAGTWTASPLPAGLKLTATKGIISGTPTKAGDTQVTLGFTQKSGNLKAAKVTLTLRVNQAKRPVITTTGLQRGVVGTPYKKTLIAEGRPAGTWATTELPDGLSLNATTGVISGTPTNDAVGTTQVSVGFKQTNSKLTATPKTFTLQIDQRPAPVISTDTLPVGSTDEDYSAMLTAVGDPVGTWTATPLPDGLTLDADTGVISGRPTASGETNVVLGFTQTSTGLAAPAKTVLLQVDPGDNPVIETSSLPNATRLSTYQTTLTAVGNPVGTWTATPLPDGLTLDADTGVISGTPTTIGDTEVVIGFTETATSLAATPRTLVLTVDQAAAPEISTTGLPDGKRFAPYTAQLNAVGDPVGTWTATTLPAGLTLNADTGAITGTPSAAGDTVVEIGFTQTSTGVPAVAKSFVLHVENVKPPVIETGILPSGRRFDAYSTTLVASGSQGANQPGTWSASPLPAGLTLNPSTGVISGTPTVADDTAVVVKFTETRSGLQAAQKTLTLHVDPALPPTITTPALADARSNDNYSFQMQVAGNPVGTWSATGLPNGFSINAATGVITGNPGLVLLPYKRTVTFKFTQTNTGLSTTKDLVLYVKAGL